MKANIQPQWFNDAKVTCACGNTFTTGSTKPKAVVEICSNCHPFFTGQQKFVDTLGQVDKFQKKAEASQAKAAQKQAVLRVRAAKKQTAAADKPSLKELLMQARKNLHS